MEKRVGIKVNRNNNMKTISKKKKEPEYDFRDAKVPGLPKNFFEKVLECEVKLKEKFDMKVLQQLIEYYSMAVGYYESINDPKYMMYNQSLTLLFSQPEVKKYISGGNINLKLKKEQIQKIINESDKSDTTEKVRNFIRRKKSVDSKKQINNLINKDMDTQTNDFKRRLAEKKKKYYLSTSDIGASNNIGKSLKNLGLNNEFKSEKNLEYTLDKEFNFSEKEIPNINKINNINNINGSGNNGVAEKNSGNEVGNNSSKNIASIGEVVSNGTNNILDELKKEDMNNEIKLGEENNLNDSFENKLDFNLETNNISNKNLPINKTNIKFTKKTKFIEKMKLNFDIYANDYYDNFIKKISEQIIKDYNTHFTELTQAVMDSAVNYVNQEKEMEFLLSSDSDEAYRKEIGTIVQQLKEEEISTKEKLISDDNVKLDKLKEKYCGTLNMTQSGHDLEMLKEKFRLDITKSLNNLVFK